jgi:hypothetical protein
MRALVLTAVLVTLFGLYLLLAQDQAKPLVSGSQPAQAQGNPNAPAKQDLELSGESQKRRVLERMGPGIDWDHRKTGRDLRISPGRVGDDVKRERD